MRIGIEYASALNGRGIGRYIYNVVKQLSKIDLENEYVIYTNISYESQNNLSSNFSIKKISFKNKHKFIQIKLPELAKKDKLDLLWCPANEFPVFLNKNISLFVTIHDVIFFRKETEYKNRSTKLLKLFSQIGKKKPKIIFTDSEYSKTQIHKILNVQIDKIKVVDLKIDHTISDIKNNAFDEKILSKLGIYKKGYFYTVLSPMPHKNLKTLLKAFKSEFIKYPLVVTGCNKKNTWLNEYFLNNPKMKTKVILTERISDKELNSLYKNCAGFLFPTLEEGFGFPLLEAMCFNVPIICSDSPPMNTIADDNVVLVPPNDYNMYIKEIQKILDNKIEFNVEMRKNQINKFTNWEKSAEEILKTFLEYK